MKEEYSQPLRIIVIGANGGIGKQVVELALKEGHHVIAFLRDRTKLMITHPNLKIAEGDLMKPGSIEPFLETSDVVISAIGNSSLKKTTLYSQGNQNLIHTMERAGTERVFFISASGIDVNPSHSFIIRFATKYILQKILKHMYADLERMESLVKRSPLNWTIVRPPRLTDESVTGNYRVAINRFIENPMTISRADVAHYMIHHLLTKEIFRTTVELAY